jgi:predicted xylose isomerase-like sugar epimerase
MQAGQIWLPGDNKAMKIRLKFADLDEKNVARVKSLEEETGTIILALQAVHPFANLSDEALERIKELEKEFGVVILAYQPDVT